MKKLPIEIVFELKSVHLEAEGFLTYHSILVSHSMFIWNRWAASVVRVGERFHENCACYVFTASMKTMWRSLVMRGQNQTFKKEL